MAKGICDDCCCCGCFFTFLLANCIAIIISGLCLVPNLLIGIGGAIIVSAFTFFQTFIKTYYAIFVSKMFGWKLRTLIILTAWIPLIAYPFLSIIVATIVDVLYTLVFVYGLTVANISEGKSCCDCYSTISTVSNTVVDFFHWNYYTIPMELDNLIKYGGRVYEINILNTIVGTIIGVIGSAVMCITFTILAILKYFPFLLKIVIQIGKNCSADCCGIFFLVIFVLCLVSIGLSPLVIPLSFLGGLLAGFPVVYEYINTGNARLAILLIGEIIYSYDVMSSKVAFDWSSFSGSSENEFSCFSCFDSAYKREKQRYETQNNVVRQLYRETYAEQTTYQTSTAPRLPTRDVYHTIDIQPSAPVMPSTTTSTIFTVQEIWNGFFEMCEQSAMEAVITKLITIDDFESYESYLFIGLSSLVAFNSIERSMGINGIKLHSGKIVDIFSRPTDTFSVGVYDTVIDIKGKYKELNPTHREIMYMKKWLLTVGDEIKCANYSSGISEQRLLILKQFTSHVQSLGTNVTKAPTFHRLFGNTISKVISQKEELTRKIVRNSDNFV